MSKLDGTGPIGTGSGSGRKLGKCDETPAEEKLKKLGKGLGTRRKSAAGEGEGKGKGKGKRLRSGQQ